MDGKGYLLNEPGAQPTSVYADFSCKEESEVDSLGGKKPLDLYGFLEKGEPQGCGEAWGQGWGAVEVKASFFNSSGYRQLANGLPLPCFQAWLKDEGGCCPRSDRRGCCICDLWGWGLGENTPAPTPHTHTTFFTSSRGYRAQPPPCLHRPEEHGHQLAGQPAAPSQAALHPGHSLCAIAWPPALLLS